jgi:DNA polymerase sigma
MEFFHYYGYDFNYTKVVISVAFPEGFQSKTTSQFRCRRQPYLVSIVNPFERTQDIGRNAFMVIWARQAYRTSYKDLLAAAEAFPEIPSLLLKGDTDHLLVDPTFPILSQLIPPHHLTTVLRRSMSLKLRPNRFFEKLMQSGQRKRRWRSSNSPSIIKKRRLVVERVEWHYNITPLQTKKKVKPVFRKRRRVIKTYTRHKTQQRRVLVG